MAGGVNAAIVPCGKCAGPSHRTYEGQEDDHYRCSECGYTFGIDWHVDGPPQYPCWPISEEKAEEIRKTAVQIFGVLRKSGDSRSD
jgi:hypothetical protein